MAITRAQQAKQLLAQGGRIGLKGGADAATESFGASVGYGDGRPGGSTGRKGSVNIDSSGNVTFNPGGKDSPVERDTGLERERKRNITKLDKFKDTKPKVKTPGPFKYFKGPLQKFSDFTTARNRAFFENVIRAGKIPGLNFATLDDLTPQQLEDKYQDYMSDRLAGNIDAYGNPLMRGDDGPDPIPFIPEPIKEEPVEEVAEYVNPLSLLTPRIAGSRFLGTEFAADGGRIGLKGGADAATESFTKSSGSSAKGRKGSVNVGAGGATFNPGGRDERPDDRSTFEQTVNQRRITNEAKRQKPSNLENMFKTASELNYLRNLIKMNPQGLGLSYFTNKIGNLLFPPAGAAEFDMEAFQKAGAEKGFFGANDELEAMQKYFDFAQKQKAMGKDPAAIRDSANIGSALYGIDMDLVPETFLQTEEDFAKQKAPESFFAKGGIASLDREAFLLGGIAKGLKKAVRGVKKIAKSPIGKAALLGAGMFGIPGTTFGGLLGRASFGGAAQGMFGSFGPVSALKKLGIMKTQIEPGLFERVGLLSKLNLPMAGIFGASALAGLMTPKEEEDKFDLAKYYSQSLTPSQSVRGMGSEFDFYGAQFVADGGRIGYQEGSKEPVAKKTLPLIDMDGMEKDYRETGGFVEMGRMEKADDVPARLSKNEFVFTADAVRNAGDGDVDKGAEVMYNMMKNLEAGGDVSEESQGLKGAREMFQTAKRLEDVV